MKSDLQINSGQLTDLYHTIVNYRLRVQHYQGHANYFHYVLTQQQSIAFHQLAQEWEQNVLDRIQRLIDRLNQAEQLLLDYIYEMTDIITPLDPQKPMRVDRLNIAYNLKQTEQQLLNAMQLISHYCNTPHSQPMDEPTDNPADELQRLTEQQKRQRNYQKLQSFQQGFQKAITNYLENDLWTLLVATSTFTPFLAQTGLLPEEMEQTYENFYGGLTTILLDPIQTIESMGQQKMDTYDQETW